MRPTLLVVCVMIALKMATGSGVWQLSTSLPIFSQRLYQKLALSRPNVVYSPYSIQAALGLLLLGSREQTSTEILQVAFPQAFPQTGQTSIHSEFQELLNQWTEVKDVELDNANALFLSPAFSIQSQYEQDANNYYSAHISNFDLSAPGGAETPINNFVTQKTKGFINNLIDKGSITPLTKVILANAVFFNGTWEEVFSKDLTRQRDFNTLDRGTIQLDTMVSERYSQIKQDVHGADVIELPFVGSRFALYIALPQAIDGITDLENRLNTPGAVNELFEDLDDEYVRLILPKFKIESDFQLNEPLLQLGIISAFSDDANFTGISRENGLYISEAVHKAVIDVTETGTVASAATAFILGIKSGPGSEFKVDHPFLFFLRDKETNIVLFQGKYSG